MNPQQVSELAAYILQAQDEKYEIRKLTAEKYPDLTIDEAYLIQEQLMKMRLARGDAILGPKMGLTSYAKLKQMHVTDPIYGYIFKSMHVPEGSTIMLTNYIHPKVEPEIGFILKNELKGPNMTKEQVLEATEYVFPAIEIIDSRFENFDFTMPDVIADNTSASGAVMGTTMRKATSLDLETIGVYLTINGKVKTIGAGAAVLGHPAEAIAALANMLAEKGEVVEAGQPILSGGLTAATTIAKGDHIAVYFGENLGSVEFFVAN
ncbi:MAG: fumarylacetoacetate hydrolase family protein [Kurthia sp.]|nr:fumarylacetoacetate hydrolase family protein [Candidatus Kurthia equi]